METILKEILLRKVAKLYYDVDAIGEGISLALNTEFPEGLAELQTQLVDLMMLYILQITEDDANFDSFYNILYDHDDDSDKVEGFVEDILSEKWTWN